MRASAPGCSRLATVLISGAPISTLIFMIRLQSLLLFSALLLNSMAPTANAQDTAAAHHQRGLAHDRRALNDASCAYAQTLALDPPRVLTTEEWQLVRRFAPRLYTTPNEVFPLKDFAVIVHPTERLIALATTNSERAYYRVGASVHYEVEHSNPNHAGVEGCPTCGRTGEYAALQGNLVDLVHDPLGLELVLTGKIRGEVVRFEDQTPRAAGSPDGLKEKFVVQQFLFPAQTGDRNTLRIGVVVINNK